MATDVGGRVEMTRAAAETSTSAWRGIGVCISASVAEQRMTCKRRYCSSCVGTWSGCVSSVQVRFGKCRATFAAMFSHQVEPVLQQLLGRYLWECWCNLDTFVYQGTMWTLSFCSSPDTYQVHVKLEIYFICTCKSIYYPPLLLLLYESSAEWVCPQQSGSALVEWVCPQ